MEEELELDDESVCSLCHGNGVVATYEQVIPGESHIALVGERPCDCQILDEDVPEEYSE